MLGDSSTRALRNDIFPPKKRTLCLFYRSFECNSTFRGMLSYTAMGNLPETRLISSARTLTHLQPGGYSLERGLAPYLSHGGWSGVGRGSWGGSHGERGRGCSCAGVPRAAHPEPAALRQRGGGGQDRTETKKSSKRQAGKEASKEGEKKRHWTIRILERRKEKKAKRLKTHQRVRKCYDKITGSIRREA